MNTKEIIELLIEETFEDAVFSFISALSAYGIQSIEDAVAAAEKDAETMEWLKLTIERLP